MVIFVVLFFKVFYKRQCKALFLTFYLEKNERCDDFVWKSRKKSSALVFFVKKWTGFKDFSRLN